MPQNGKPDKSVVVKPPPEYKTTDYPENLQYRRKFRQNANKLVDCACNMSPSAHALTCLRMSSNYVKGIVQK